MDRPESDQTEPAARVPAVLVASPDPFVRGGVAAFLRCAGVPVTEVGDEVAVVEACRAAPDEFAAVLMDIRLPGPGCAWVLAGVRLAAPRVQRFLMSGNPGAYDLTELGRAGADRVFARPFDMTALRSAVAAAVANRIGDELFGNGA